jgi:uncharacterized protein (DUF305 family)
MRYLKIAALVCMFTTPVFAAEDAPEVAANKQAMSNMHKKMMVDYSGDADIDFVRGMIPHHEGAVDMAKVVLEYGKDPEIRKLAKAIIKAQQKEIKQMGDWQKKHDTQAVN